MIGIKGRIIFQEQHRLKVSAFLVHVRLAQTSLAGCQPGSPEWVHPRTRLEDTRSSEPELADCFVSLVLHGRRHRDPTGPLCERWSRLRQVGAFTSPQTDWLFLSQAMSEVARRIMKARILRPICCNALGVQDKFAALRTKIFTESIESSNEPRYRRTWQEFSRHLCTSAGGGTSAYLARWPSETTRMHQGHQASVG